MRSVVRLAAVMLGLVALAHFLRLIFNLELSAGGVSIPLWASGVAALLAGVVAVLLWREQRRR